jgi:hypothetical protein
MNNVRLQICTGLFRSASNLETLREHARASSAATPRRWARPTRRLRARPADFHHGDEQRSRRGGAGTGNRPARGDDPPGDPEGWPQRSVPVRQRKSSSSATASEPLVSRLSGSPRPAVPCPKRAPTPTLTICLRRSSSGTRSTSPPPSSCSPSGSPSFPSRRPRLRNLPMPCSCPEFLGLHGAAA